ncbi:MAG: hypothetical protein MZV70_44135 [Desulfobacterales bacterium]|nr:hypothetical protein [Desulfobacterales bacterium]
MPRPFVRNLASIDWTQFVDVNALPATAETVTGIDADWRCLCLPGTVFEPGFTVLLAATMQRYPQWQFMYFDEDRIGKNGQFIEPMLKPGLTLICFVRPVMSVIYV